MNTLLQRLHMPETNTEFAGYVALAETEPALPQWLEEDFIRALDAQLHVLPTYLEQVIAALPLVKANPDLVLLAKAYYHLLTSEDASWEGITLPVAPADADPLPYDIIGIYPTLAGVQASYEKLQARGIPEEILQHTFCGIDASMHASTERVGRVSFNMTYFSWCRLYVHGTLLPIGRFNFQIVPASKLQMQCFRNTAGEITVLMDKAHVHRSGHLVNAGGCEDTDGAFQADCRETENSYIGYPVNPTTHLVEKHQITLSKAQWQPMFRPGDHLISVHIPAGGHLDPEYCQRSYDMARELYTRCYPEYRFSLFVCFSWLLAPELEELLDPDTNIMKFRSQYYTYPIDGRGLGVFHFLFTMQLASRDSLDLDKLTPKSSLQRKLVEHYRQGKWVHEFAGFFPFAKDAEVTC